MSDSTSSVHTLIIGGGFAGLCAAARLAKQGHAVALFEASQQLGGRARTRVIEGHAFNLGPHALYAGGRAQALLNDLDLNPPGGAPKTAGGYAFLAQKNHTLPTGFASLLTTGLLSVPGKFAAARFMARAGQIKPQSLKGQTVAQWLTSLNLGPEAQSLAEAFIRLSTYVHAPQQLCAALALKQLQLGLSTGVRYLDGGWQPMVDSLAKYAQDRGAQLQVGAKVRTLHKTTPGYRAEVEGHDDVQAQNIIIATPPKPAAALLGGLSGSTSWAQQLQPIKASCLDVALRELPRPTATFGLGIDRATYASVHSAAADLGPGAVVHVAQYLGPQEAPASRTELEALLNRLQPGFRDQALHMEYHPQMIVSHALPRPDGQDVRPGPQGTGLAGVYLAGEWVRSEGWLLDAAAASAEAAVAAIVCTNQAERAA